MINHVKKSAAEVFTWCTVGIILTKTHTKNTLRCNRRKYYLLQASPSQDQFPQPLQSSSLTKKILTCALCAMHLHFTYYSHENQ